MAAEASFVKSFHDHVIAYKRAKEGINYLSGRSFDRTKSHSDKKFGLVENAKKLAILEQTIGKMFKNLVQAKNAIEIDVKENPYACYNYIFHGMTGISDTFRSTMTALLQRAKL